MKLHWSPRSPYVRKVMIFAHEAGLASSLDCVRSVAVRTSLNPQIAQDSPVGRIPVLVLDSGTVLSGSYHICEYLQSQTGVCLIPPPGENRWKQLEFHGVADGLLDTLIYWRGEYLTPETIAREDIVTTCSQKTQACLNWMENKAEMLGELPFGIGAIAVGVSLSYLDFRYPQVEWRAGRLGLAAWYEGFCKRPSSVATEIANDE